MARHVKKRAIIVAKKQQLLPNVQNQQKKRCGNVETGAGPPGKGRFRIPLEIVHLKRAVTSGRLRVLLNTTRQCQEAANANNLQGIGHQ